ncbi:MAG: hypothetical protein JXB48_18940, partial [Candidatus Latescibacteria bacterium]|nr:hypothetical protein [Candidatus Latescibacterota bacterium]
LLEYHKLILNEYLTIKESEKKFTSAYTDFTGEPCSHSLDKLRLYNNALKNNFLISTTKFTKDLLQIIRDIHYVITDTTIYKSVPGCENDVHIRIEAILKCVFPDLKRKPRLTKHIKNFEPDTGIPSLQTLIEYKYLSRQQEIGSIADQLLADTRGYTSKDWSNFIYVIYETKRFRPEKDWNLFLRESEVPSNTTVVVLSGESPEIKKRKPNVKLQNK